MPKRSSGGFFLPASFTARFAFAEDHTVELDIAVEGDEPVCNSIRVVRRPDGPALTGVELRRLPVTRWVDIACAEAAWRVRASGELVPIDDAEFNEAHEAFARPRRRNRVTDERLREVARICREYAEPGVARFHLVVDAFHVSRSQAYRLIDAAVAAGYLEEEA